MLDVPAGFRRHFRTSPVTDAWEPLYSRCRSDGADMLFEVAQAHCNSRGYLHGGVLATLSDVTMGLALGLVVNDPRANIVTISLSLDYLGSAKIGDAVAIEAHVVRVGSTISCCQALTKRGDAVIARSNANFSVRVVERVSSKP